MIPIIDTLQPLGGFPVAKSKDIDVNGERLDAVLNNKPNTADVAVKADKTYVETELNKKANTSLLESKVDKIEGKGLSTNDYSDAERSKVETASAAASSFNSLFTKID